LPVLWRPNDIFWSSWGFFRFKGPKYYCTAHGRFEWIEIMSVFRISLSIDGCLKHYIIFYAKRNYFLMRISPQTLFSSSTEASRFFMRRFLWRWTKCRMWVISVYHIRSFRWRFNMRPYVKWSDRRRISSILFF
jgi:hypothetical protein